MSPQIENWDRVMKDVPAMPAVAQKVMHMMGDPRVTNAQLGDTLASDQSMASRILQMANSPFFGARQKIASISNAIFVLGHSALRSLIITACTKGLYKNPGDMERALWEKALSTAVASRRVAQKTSLADPEEIFVGGLLHNVGQTILASIFRSDFEPLFQKMHSGEVKNEGWSELERDEFGYDHCEVGSRVIQKWRLPNVYARIARRYRSTEVATLQQEEHPQVIAMVGQAHLTTLRLGMGLTEPDRTVDLTKNIYAQMLNLEGEAIKDVAEYTVTTYNEYRHQFDLDSE